MVSIYSYNYVTRKLTNILGKIVDKNIDNFRANQSFKVWTDYAYGKFYLNKIGKDYDMSLEGLIHHILYAEKLYFKFLTKGHFRSIKEVVKNHSSCKYFPCTENDREEDLMHLISQFIANVTDYGIGYVANKLKSQGFDKGSTFAEYDEVERKSFINYLKRNTYIKRNKRIKIRASKLK